jgi:hypothetical protein
MDGEQLWISSQLDGVSAGTPLAGSNGDYVFLTHNSELGTVGHFTVLQVTDGGNGRPFYSQQNETSPFSPPGMFHRPVEGYYDGENGFENTNDIIAWSFTPKPDDTALGEGAMFGFQFPVGFADDAAGLFYLLLGTESRNFQTITPPVFTNEGRSMYVSRSQGGFSAWVGEEGFARYFFSRNTRFNTGFDRGDPPVQAIFAPPALSSNTSEPVMFGGTASELFVRTDFALTELTAIEVVTTSIVKTKAIVAPADDFVYYIESGGGTGGIIHQANFDDLTDRWTFEHTADIEGDFALRSDGAVLYFAGVSGNVTALQLAEILSPVPSESPSDAPTFSAAPTMMPVDLTPAPVQTIVVPETTPAPTPAPSSTPSPTSVAAGSEQATWKLLLAGAVVAVMTMFF